jgi:hypothetical protein
MADKLTAYAVGSTNVLDFTSTSASSAVFGSETWWIRIAANAAVNYRVLDPAMSSTATSTDPLLPSAWVEILKVTPGQRISAIKGSGGTITSADGRMTITELS